MTMDEAAEKGEIFITTTGMKDIIVKRHFEKMKDGTIICNTGHYDCEINIPGLESLTESKRTIRANCEEYQLKNGNRIYLLAKGRLINLAAAEGHPSEVMDMSFANQLLSLVRLAKEGNQYENKVYDIPEEQDEELGRIKLETMGMKIDTLTEEQEKYTTAYEVGT